MNPQELLVSLFYFLVFSFFIYKSGFLRLRTISKKNLVILFTIKILAAFLYVYISSNVIKAGDCFSYYKDGLHIYQLLCEGKFTTFLQLVFGPNNVAITPNIASSVAYMGFWYDTSSYMMVRANALFNLFTFGSGVYANAIFFAFLSFLAAVFLALIFEKNLRNNKSWLSYVIFLSPSLLYWTSGMHKESISVFLLSASLWTYLYFLKHRKISFLLICFFTLALLFATRYFIVLMLLPPFLAYALSYRYPKIRPALFTLSVYAFVIAISYLFPVIFQAPNLVDAIIAKKELYEALENANTAIHLGEYQQSYWGIFLKLPQALFNALVRPHFLDIHTPFLALASIESFFMSLAFLVSLFYFKNLSRKRRALLYLFYSFALSYLLLTGLIVPNLGAIVRYRSVALFFLLPAIAYLWSKKDKFLV